MVGVPSEEEKLKKEESNSSKKLQVSKFYRILIEYYANFGIFLCFCYTNILIKQIWKHQVIEKKLQIYNTRIKRSVVS